ncbi:MAG: hypothetical protein Q9209_004692 [Squamulea sp. 1 TL-2023]
MQGFLLSLTSQTRNTRRSWQILRDQIFRLVFTAVLVALVIITLKVYEQKGSVGHHNKIVFNTIITALNLALGLNFLVRPQEAFKDMAKTDTKKLAQASIALIGLNYSMNNGVDSTEVTSAPGTVSFAKIDCYYNNEKCTTDPNQPPEVAQNQAHSYGEASLRERAYPYGSDDDIFDAPQNCTYFAHTNQQEFAFRYAEYNPDDRARAYPFLTKRLIKTLTGRCFQYKAGGSYFKKSNDGPDSVRVWSYSNDTTDGVLRIARTDTGYDSTTYAYTGVQAPQNATAVTCGPRCIWLYAGRQSGVNRRGGDDIFKCPITVSEVSNVGNPAHIVPDQTARLAAASIALSGRYTNPNGSEFKHWQQYQCGFHSAPTGNSTISMPRASDPAWLSSPLSHSPQWRIIIFMIGSQAPSPFLASISPCIGNIFIALAAVITGIHCLLVALILFIARPVVIPADSNLVVAKLLHGLVGRMGDRGNLLGAKEIADAIQNESGQEDGKHAVGYGVRQGVHGAALEIGEGLVKRKDLSEGRFPKQVYA